MLRHILNNIALATCILLVSCTDKLDVEFENGPEYLVISGRITNEYSPQSIRITRSTPIASTGNPPGVSGATIKVSDSEGITHHYYEGSESGVYNCTSQFEGKVGVTYTMDITVDADGDGISETFTASDTMGEGVTIKRMKLQKYSFLTQKIILVLLWGELPDVDNKSGYCLDLMIKGESDKTRYTDMLIIKDELSSTNVIDSIPFFYINPTDKNDKFQFHEGNTVTVKVLSPSEKYYKFLVQTKENMSSDIPIYGGPPANSTTNIRQTGGTQMPLAGFFAACSQSKISVVIDEELLK